MIQARESASPQTVGATAHADCLPDRKLGSNLGTGLRKRGVVDGTAPIEPRRGCWTVAIFPSGDFTELDIGAVSSAQVQPQRASVVRNLGDL